MSVLIGDVLCADEWGVIAGFLKDVVDTRSFGLVCTRFREIMLKVDPAYAQECSTLQVMVRKFPNAPWDWDTLRQNPCYIRRGKNNIYYCTLDADPSLSLRENLERTRRLLDARMAIHYIIAYPAMKDQVLAGFAGIAREWHAHEKNAGLSISMNPALTWKDIAAHPEIPWNWRMMSMAGYN